MSRKILGLDIRSTSATAVLIETGLKKCAVTGYLHAPFAEGGSFQDQLTDALSTISENIDLKDCISAVSIPSNRFFYRNVAVPFGETKKIQQVLPYELESTLPFPVEDLLIDFNKLQPSGSDGETRIIAAGIETDWLKSLLDTLVSCGVASTVLLPGGYATAALLGTRDVFRGTVIFLDFDGKHCCLYLIMNGEISLIRSFPLPPAQLESAFHVWGHIQRSVAGFESLFEVKLAPDTLVINGFTDDNFVKQLEKASSVPVEILHMHLPDRCEILNVDPEILTPRCFFNNAFSCALSLIEGIKLMNFRKGPLAARNSMAQYRTKLIQTSAIAAGVILLWIAGALIDIHVTRKKVGQIDSKIEAIFKSTFPDVTRIVKPVHLMRSRIELMRKAAFSSVEDVSQVRAVDLLRDISRVIPESTEVRFSKFNISDDGIYIDGTTTSFNLVDDIKSKIESLKSVSSVTTPTTKREDDGIRFNLRIETNPEETS